MGDLEVQDDGKAKNGTEEKACARKTGVMGSLQSQWRLETSVIE